MDAIVSELFKVMPFGQAVGVVLLAFILRILWQSRDKLQEVSATVTGMNGWMNKHEDEDKETFREIRDSIRALHSRIDNKADKL